MTLCPDCPGLDKEVMRQRFPGWQPRTQCCRDKKTPTIIVPKSMAHLITDEIREHCARAKIELVIDEGIPTTEIRGLSHDGVFLDEFFGPRMDAEMRRINCVIQDEKDAAHANRYTPHQGDRERARRLKRIK